MYFSQGAGNKQQLTSWRRRQQWQADVDDRSRSMVGGVERQANGQSIGRSKTGTSGSGRAQQIDGNETLGPGAAECGAEV
jgi:hypothetical protein